MARPHPSVRDGNGLRQPSPDADRFDTLGEPGPVICLDIDPAQRAFTKSRSIALSRQLGRKALDGVFLLHPDHAVMAAAHAGIRLIARAAFQDHEIRGGHMGVAADNKAGAPVAMMAHRHLLARRLAMNIHDHRIDGEAERHFIQNTVGMLEGVFQLLFHEHIALELDHADAAAIIEHEDMSALAGGAGGGRIVGRTQETRFARNIGQGLALVPGMIAQRQAIGARIEEVAGDGFGETLGAVITSFGMSLSSMTDQ